MRLVDNSKTPPQIGQGLSSFSNVMILFWEDIVRSWGYGLAVSMG